MIPFWNPWNQGSAQEVFPGYLVIISIISNVQNIQKTGDLEDLGHLDRDFVILIPGIFGHHHDDQEGPECQNQLRI